MITKILKEFFSMRMIAVALFIFLFVIALATFIESDYGTPASKIAVYNTRWFELLLLYLTIGLVVNMFRYKMFDREKVALLTFHVSFIIIIIGAALTRYVGYEGSMPIKEGESSNVIFSADPYISVNANDLKHQFEYKKQHWLSEGVQNPFKLNFQLPDQPKINIEYVSYLENFLDTVIIADSIQGRALDFVVKGETEFLFDNAQRVIGGLNFSFNKADSGPGVNIWEEGGDLWMRSVAPFQIVDMMMLNKEDQVNNRLDSAAVTIIPSDSTIRFYNGRLYVFENESIMFREIRNNIAQTRIKAKQRDEGTHYLTIRVSSESNAQLVELPANHDRIMDPVYFQFEGINFEIGYGAKPIFLPFYVKCRDFQLDRYPGSNMASSFASEVSVVDEENGVTFDKRIFMNNVMDYNGFRFFQSSYFPDESGTVLSVNYDWWGTNVTYLGYLLMTVGMMLSLFAPKGRFMLLNNLIKKSRENRAKMNVLILALLSSSLVFAHGDHDHDHNHDHDHHHEEAQEPRNLEEVETPIFSFAYITKEQSKDLASLLVQDYDGRIIPFHTLSDRVLRKVYQDNKFDGKNAVQVVFSFHLFPDYWWDKQIVYVSAKIRDGIGLGKHAAMLELEAEDGNFKWLEEYQNAFEKPESKRTEFDKQIMKLGERYQVLKEVFTYQHLRIVPVPGDMNGLWVWPFSIDLRELDQTGNKLAGDFLRAMFMVTQGQEKYTVAKAALDDLIEHQWSLLEIYRNINPSAELPDQSKIDAEIFYNELNAFNRIQNIYFILGFLMLIVFFIQALVKQNDRMKTMFKRITIPFVILVVVVFILHGLGLGYRWYISGHAPWSNGYEAVIFIAWTTVLSGFLFTRKNPAVLPATALLAGMMLFVTELNLLDPEITPLQPVLKSYWLMIHVAIITSSYGFLGLSAILAIVNMTLYLFRNKNNKRRLNMNANELTAVSEMSMTIGLFMLTIGTFLGGVWANESWGRYWGWDPKETWALVSVLTYAIILHLRFIPKLGDKFIFNVFALWGYSAILFTFFGVNFKLVGLHSYAQGDGVAETPLWVWTTIFVFFLFTIASAVRYVITKQR